jgi:hypothetical protein
MIIRSAIVDQVILILILVVGALTCCEERGW